MREPLVISKMKKRKMSNCFSSFFEVLGFSHFRTSPSSASPLQGKGKKKQKNSADTAGTRTRASRDQ